MVQNREKTNGAKLIRHYSMTEWVTFVIEGLYLDTV